MKTTILSKRMAQEYKPETDYSVIIRIGDPEEEMPELLHRNEMKDILCLEFYDLTESQAEGIVKSGGSYHKVISEEDAKAIHEFFQKHENCKEMIVHCHGGISRSAGVAVAWATYKNREDIIKEIWDDMRYLPNQTVTQKIVSQFKQP